jgi:hypothetical protein
MAAERTVDAGDRRTDGRVHHPHHRPCSDGDDRVTDLLQPTTDAGVALQLVLVLVGAAIALGRSWHRADLRLVVIGLTLLLLGLMGLRAVH